MKKVIVGMSGGVDSAVTAGILKKQGYDVIGVTMKIVPDKYVPEKYNEKMCCSLDAVEDARRVAFKLDIPFYVMNFQEVFKEKVIDYFIDEYERGKTPNPCIACNNFVKFDALLQRAISMNIDYVATGHYAKINFDNDKKRYLLKKSVTAAKDQTYVLYNLTQHQLKHILMPLGDFTKDQVRQIAKDMELSVANKSESQEICFIPNNNYSEFIQKETKENYKNGPFVDTKGNVIGQHNGIINYTIGQRKNLGMSFGKPMYVVSIDTDTNIITLGEKGEEYSNGLIARDINLISQESIKRDLNVTAKIRYSAKEAKAVISPREDNKLMVKFDKPQRAITPGQAVVFYDGDIVVGGGIIESVL